MKTDHIDAKRAEIVEKREKLIVRFNQAARLRRSTRHICTEIRRANDILSTLDKIVAENTQGGGARRYAVSSLFLYDCHRKLTADKDEQFFFVTGSEVEGVHVLDQWAEFAHEKRNRVAVVAEPASTHKLLIKLEEFGHKFLGHFHSHPGNGPSASLPSGTDRNFQQRLESAGHLAVMAIFSRDGFIRFIRLDGNCDIEIYGKGVEKHATSVYRLTELD